MKNYTEQMQGIVKLFRDSGEPWPASTHQIAAWAIRNNKWAPQPSSIVDICASQLARAMREDYFTDPQGRRVRSKHAARINKSGKQVTLWADLRSADRKHVEIAFQQRRQQIVGDCSQLKKDVDSFNENRSESHPIQMVFDFTQDLDEIEAVENLDQETA